MMKLFGRMFCDFGTFPKGLEFQITFFLNGCDEKCKKGKNKRDEMQSKL